MDDQDFVYIDSCDSDTSIALRSVRARDDQNFVYTDMCDSMQASLSLTTCAKPPWISFIMWLAALEITNKSKMDVTLDWIDYNQRMHICVLYFAPRSSESRTTLDSFVASSWRNVSRFYISRALRRLTSENKAVWLTKVMRYRRRDIPVHGAYTQHGLAGHASIADCS